jgi:group I intron endonuclease
MRKNIIRAVYLIKCAPNGGEYIGSTVNFASRMGTHRSHLRTGIHPNRALQADWDKHGAENFEIAILEECTDALTAREQFYIDKAKAEGKSLYNVQNAHLSEAVIASYANVRRSDIYVKHRLPGVGGLGLTSSDAGKIGGSMGGKIGAYLTHKIQRTRTDKAITEAIAALQDEGVAVPSAAQIAHGAGVCIRTVQRFRSDQRRLAASTV